ncbi:MAG: hypothetical protein WCK60_03120 [Candidatus Nomurabacteria bacterium]
MEYAVWFMAALAMLATSIVVGAWRMINFKAALTCAVLMLISTLYFVSFDEYKYLFMWAVTMPLSNWILLAGFIAMTVVVWTTYGTPSGVMMMFMTMTAFTAIICGQASIVMTVAAIAIVAVAVAWGVSFITPAQWTSSGLWVRNNKLLFAGCLSLAVLAILLMLWVTGASGLAKWLAYGVIALSIVVFGQYTQTRYGTYTTIRRWWRTSVRPQLATAAVEIERFVRNGSTNYVGPFLWDIKFAIAALVPARVAYWIYQNLGTESWATKTTLFLFSLGTLAFIGLQLPRAAITFFDLWGDLGVKIRNSYWSFFKTLPFVWQILIVGGTVLNAFWCLSLLHSGKDGVGWVFGVWWVILMPLCHFGHQINAMIKKWVT